MANNSNLYEIFPRKIFVNPKKNGTIDQKKKFFTKKVKDLYKFVIRFCQKHM